jgi:hypothetical protein
MYGIAQKSVTSMTMVFIFPTAHGGLNMPARFVLVHDDPRFTNSLMTKLGSDLAWFNDPVRALKALESAKSVEFLVTRLQFEDRQPVGLSLARLARMARPDVRVIFTGAPAHRDYARGLGEFVDEPVEAVHIAMIIEWMMDVGTT